MFSLVFPVIAGLMDSPEENKSLGSALLTVTEG